MNVSVYAGPCVSEMAPLGLSKYSHIADGCLDLILTKEVDRKDFIRFMKRHGNAKNQVLTTLIYLGVEPSMCYSP